MANVHLRLALEHYDRHVPFFDGTITIDGVDLELVCAGTPVRHPGMLVRREYDAAELSLSSYLVARDQERPFTAIPVFPRRLFSQSQMYRNTEAGIAHPRDLVGRRVGLNSYQTTLSVLAKGDLQRDYGVPWKEICWVTGGDELVEAELPADVQLERAPDGADLGQLLAEGDLAAMMTPRPPSSYLAGDPRVGRLFSDPRAEEQAYAERHGCFPIMHVVALKEEIDRQHPWVAPALFDAFERANRECARHYDDPNWSMLAWGRQWWEEERARFGHDPWTNGLAANRSNLDWFIGYSIDQGLIRRPIAPESLFTESTLET